MSIPHPCHTITLDADARTFIFLCFSKFLSANEGKNQLITIISSTEFNRQRKTRTHRVTLSKSVFILVSEKPGTTL